MRSSRDRNQYNNNIDNTDNEQVAPQRPNSNFVPQQLNHLWTGLNAGFYNNQNQAVNNYGRTNTSATTNNSGWAWLSLQTDNMKHRVLSNSKEYKDVKNALKVVSSNGNTDDITKLKNACKTYLTSTLGLTDSCNDKDLREAVQNSNKKTTTGQVRLMWVYFMWEIAQNPQCSPLAQQQMLQREAAVTRKEAEVTQREEDVTQREEDVTQREEDVTQREAAVTQREEDVTQREATVTRKEAEVTQREEAVAQKEMQLNRRQTSAERRAKELDDQAARLKEREAELDDKMASKATDDEIIQRKNVLAQEREKAAQEREKAEQEREKAEQEKEKAAQEREKAAQERNEADKIANNALKALREMAQKLEKKEKEIEELRMRSNYAQLETALRRNWDEINSQIEIYKQLVTNSKEQFSKSNELLSAYQKRIEDMEAECNDRINTLVDMYNDLVDKADSQLAALEEYYESKNLELKISCEHQLDEMRKQVASLKAKHAEDGQDLKMQIANLDAELSVERMAYCRDAVLKYMDENGIYDIDYDVDMSKKTEYIGLKKSTYEEAIKNKSTITIALPYVKPRMMKATMATVKVEMKEVEVDFSQVYPHAKLKIGAINLHSPGSDLGTKKPLKRTILLKETLDREAAERKMIEEDEERAEAFAMESQVKTLEEQNTSLAAQIQELKAQVSEANDQVQEVNVPVPVQCWCQGLPAVIEINGYQCRFVPVVGMSAVLFAGCGAANENGTPRDLKLNLQFNTEDGMYTMDANGDVTRNLVFRQQDAGVITTFPLPNPKTQAAVNVTLTVTEQKLLVAEGGGALKADGTYGNFYIQVTLQ